MYVCMCVCTMVWTDLSQVHTLAGTWDVCMHVCMYNGVDRSKPRPYTSWNLRCMYVCVYVCVCIYVLPNVQTLPHTSTHTCIYKYIYIHTYIHAYKHTTHTHTHMYLRYALCAHKSGAPKSLDTPSTKPLSLHRMLSVFCVCICVCMYVCMHIA